LNGITEIGIFGSYVRGEQHAGSDIDILIALQTLDHEEYETGERRESAVSSVGSGFLSCFSPSFANFDESSTLRGVALFCRLQSLQRGA
jgi:predicted nucleotidyltransferase